MPTYEYACRDCGSHLEVVQSFSDDPLTECPHCRGQLRKVFGSIGITFKGSGFYKTDSRPGSSAKRPSGDGAKESTGDGAKEAETKKETKETKKETKAEPAAAGSSSGSDSSGGTAKSA